MVSYSMTWTFHWTRATERAPDEVLKDRRAPRGRGAGTGETRCDAGTRLGLDVERELRADVQQERLHERPDLAARLRAYPHVLVRPQLLHAQREHRGETRALLEFVVRESELAALDLALDADVQSAVRVLRGVHLRRGARREARGEGGAGEGRRGGRRTGDGRVDDDERCATSETKRARARTSPHPSHSRALRYSSRMPSWTARRTSISRRPDGRRARPTASRSAWRGRRCVALLH